MIRPTNPLSTSLWRYQRQPTRGVIAGDCNPATSRYTFGCVEQRDHLIEARPSRVHNEQAKPFVAKQHALGQQRVASNHAESRRLERLGTRFVRRAGRAGPHVNSHRYVEFLGEPPVRLEPLVVRRHPEILRLQLAESPDTASAKLAAAIRYPEGHSRCRAWPPRARRA